MKFNRAQLSNLLEALPHAARVCDEAGHIIAQNSAAFISSWGESSLDDEEVELSPLGGGYCLHVRRSDDRSGAAVPPEAALLMRGLAHELRNPLSALITATHLLKDEAGLSEESAMLLGVVKKEALRMNHVLTEFAAFLKPLPPRCASFDVAEAARRVLPEFKNDEGVVIEDNLPECLPAYGDEDQIGLALRHVLRNACEETSGRGPVRLWGRKEGNKVVIGIDDGGSGFDSEALQRAFTPFYSTKPNALGLGLALARSLVCGSGGTIHLYNLRDNPCIPDGHTAPHDAAGPLLSGARLCIELPSPSPAA